MQEGARALEYPANVRYVGPTQMLVPPGAACGAACSGAPCVPCPTLHASTIGKAAREAATGVAVNRIRVVHC